MARTKQRETYGNGSVSPVMVAKTDKAGNAVLDGDGKPAKVQERDKRGRPVWRVCVTLGTEEYTDAKGNARKRQRKVQRRVHGTLEEARKVAKGIVEQYEHVDLRQAKARFSTVAEAWLEMAQTSNLCGRDQLSQYRRHYGIMARHLDGKPIIEVKKPDVEKALAAEKKENGFSNTTMHKVFQQTNRLFEYAVDSDICVRNPCRAVAAPKKDKVQSRRALTAEEAARLRACLDRDEEAAYGKFEQKELRQLGHGNAFGRTALRGLSLLSGLMAVRLMLATGCRRGEALALAWGAVDFEASQLTIRQSLTPRLEVKEPKTGAGVRTLYVDADTMAHLRKWKEFQAKALRLVMSEDSEGRMRSVGQTRETPVCCSDAGTWYDPTNVHRWWSGYRKSIGFPDLKMHELRHTSATLLLGNGVDVKTVQHRLGHASSSLTLDQYAHAIPANDQAAADLMGSLCSAPVELPAAIVGLKRKTA